MGLNIVLNVLDSHIRLVQDQNKWAEVVFSESSMSIMESDRKN